MSKRFKSEEDIREFLETPRLANLIYHDSTSKPRGVPVWFDWDGEVLQMFSGRASPKVENLRKNPTISVLVTNHIGEPEGWVSFDGQVEISNFEPSQWVALIERVSPRYWDLNDPAYAQQIDDWKQVPGVFVSLRMKPEIIRSGA